MAPDSRHGDSSLYVYALSNDEAHLPRRPGSSGPWKRRNTAAVRCSTGSAPSFVTRRSTPGTREKPTPPWPASCRTHSTPGGHSPSQTAHSTRADRAADGRGIGTPASSTGPSQRQRRCRLASPQSKVECRSSRRTAWLSRGSTPLPQRRRGTRSRALVGAPCFVNAQRTWRLSSGTPHAGHASRSIVRWTIKSALHRGHMYLTPTGSPPEPNANAQQPAHAGVTL